MRQKKYDAPPVDKIFIVHRGAVDSYTVFSDGIAPDVYGKQYARAGSFIDEEGKVVTLTATGEAGKKQLKFSKPPIGIITETRDVTDGPRDVAILRSGEIEAQNLNYPEGLEYETGFNAQIETALPHILCYLALEDKE